MYNYRNHNSYKEERNIGGIKMANKLTNCKTCGAEIAKNAPYCPQCGAKNKRSHPILIGALIFFVVVILVGACSGGSSGDVKPVEQAANKAETAAVTTAPTVAPQNSFGVGESAELKDIVVTLVDVQESDGSQFNRPADGNVFVLCEFEIENNSQNEIAVSSLMSFTAYCDDYSCNISLSATIENENKSQLDGQVAAGKKMNGVIGYEVPADWEELEIRFTPNFWSGKEMTFVAVH